MPPRPAGAAADQLVRAPLNRPSSRLTTDGWTTDCAWAVAALAASAVFMAWWLHWFDLVDLEVYRAGASAFLHGHDVYLAHPRIIPLPFTYPPFAARRSSSPWRSCPTLVARVVMSLLSGAALVLAPPGRCSAWPPRLARPGPVDRRPGHWRRHADLSSRSGTPSGWARSTWC